MALRVAIHCFLYCSEGFTAIRRRTEQPMEPWLPCPDKASSLLVGLTGFPPLQLTLFPSLINPSARNQAVFICLKKTEKDGVGSDTDDCFLNPRLLECFTQRSALSTGGFITTSSCVVIAGEGGFCSSQHCFLINSEPAQVVWFLQERVVA